MGTCRLSVIVAIATGRIARPVAPTARRIPPARGCSNWPTSDRAQSGDSRSIARNSGDLRNRAEPFFGAQVANKPGDRRVECDVFRQRSDQSTPAATVPVRACARDIAARR